VQDARRRAGPARFAPPTGTVSILAIGWKSLIATDSALELTACCSSIVALKEHVANGSPDLALLDLTTGLTFAALLELRNQAPDCKLILWTNSLASDFALQARTIGIRGILSKTLPLEAHRECLHRVYSGELWFEKHLTDGFRVVRRVKLTQREGQLVAMLACGLKNKEISLKLGITEGTVKGHLYHLFQKSGANNRFDLARRGLEARSVAGISADAALLGDGSGMPSFRASSNGLGFVDPHEIKTH